LTVEIGKISNDGSKINSWYHNQIIIIQNDKIKKVGTNLKFGKADKVIDLSDSWVLPGLMDCHVHVATNHWLSEKKLERNVCY